MSASADHHSAWRPLLPIAAISLLLTSCVSGGDDGSGDEGSSDNGGSQGNGEPIATSLSTDTSWGPDLQFEINSLERLGEDTVRLNLAASNIGDERIQFLDLVTAPAGNSSTPDGINLIDTKNGKRHFPLMKTDGEECLCSTWRGEATIQPGEKKDIWVAFPAPPEDVTAMTVATSASPDILDIPLTEGEQEDTDISDAPVEEPKILSLSTIQEDIDGDSARDESGNETSIMLSSDVLFDTNKSELTSEADDTLEQVAQEIGDSSATTAEIDGYTDNTGNDSVNNPLSEERAESVKEKLEELVTRDGISYETAGHGSSDPVGNNDTKEGREKNRRVTITFENQGG
ncbi:OmpA family protein [Allosalinactinospora lopnorensis]|uniref:OmpA family protein n=1 Tax=Allosalinactinospora lopnorensis TaxID=1352348 RepID=UPI001F46D80B|nr:OmpA family protein [Allosalinactinospora lopnorensis]